ncbi:MAG TPA: 50S ribosomal protein L24 [Terriglobales bacterium]|nr:50S ribosomal protein L24 [Terriglobales bacterium]
MRIRKNDTVVVIAGRERGKTGKVLRVITDKERVVIEHLNMVKRHSKGRGGQAAQGIVEKEAPIHVSNLMILCDKCNAPVRTGKKLLDTGRSVRVCRRCGEQVDR